MIPLILNQSYISIKEFFNPTSNIQETEKSKNRMKFMHKKRSKYKKKRRNTLEIISEEAEFNDKENTKKEKEEIVNVEKVQEIPSLQKSATAVPYDNDTQAI